jgi:hypothetical protein
VLFLRLNHLHIFLDLDSLEILKNKAVRNILLTKHCHHILVIVF